jgi:hypothetical protein
MSLPEVAMKSRWLTGFTLRVKDSAELSKVWNDERRSRFLLRKSLRFALSFDELVWPRCGSEEEWHKIFADDLTSAYGLDGCEFLDDLMLLRRDATDARIPPLPGSCQLVAVATPYSLADFERGSDGLRASFSQVAESLPWADRWGFLGYDIVESCLGLSGLSNCGYSDGDLAILGPKYGKRLNAYGLFDQWDDAAACSHDTTMRVSEHAPFLPVALFGLDIVIGIKVAS